MFIDSAKIKVKAGDGGKGCQSYFRDNRVEHGKPNGGPGGDGGDVIFRADKSIYTLLDFQFQRHFNAESGKHGSSNTKAGARGRDLIISLPLGTVVTDLKTDCLIRDLNEDNLEVIVAHGGHGGRGNTRNHEAESGTPGEELELALNLKLIADVGLVGFPVQRQQQGRRVLGHAVGGIGGHADDGDPPEGRGQIHVVVAGAPKGD